MTPPQVIVVGDVINDVVVRPRGSVEVGTDTPVGHRAVAGRLGRQSGGVDGGTERGVRFAGRAGAADSADHLEALERAGVEPRLTDDEDLPTGTIVVLVSPDGERSMFTDRGANRALGAADLPAELLEGCRLLHVSAYPLFEPGSRDAVLQLCASAIAAGITVSIDPASAAGLRAVGRRAFLEWTSGAQLVFPNLDEGRLLTGLDDPDAIVDALSARYPVVVLKLGPAGALVATSEGRRVAVGALAAEVADSTGAGDAFCAGFVSRWLRGDDLERCAGAAVMAASRAVGQAGGRPPAA